LGYKKYSITVAFLLSQLDEILDLRLDFEV